MQPLPSGFTNFPSDKDPEGKFKFSSLVMLISLDMQITDRATYGFLEWLGDVGGLFDALKYFGILIVAPFARFNLKTELLSSIFNKHKNDSAETLDRGRMA